MCVCVLLLFWCRRRRCAVCVCVCRISLLSMLHSGSSLSSFMVHGFCSLVLVLVSMSNPLLCFVPSVSVCLCICVLGTDGCLDWRVIQTLTRSMPDLHKTLILANVSRRDSGNVGDGEFVVEEVAMAGEHAPFRHRKVVKDIGGQVKG